MAPSYLVKSVVVEVDERTWLSKAVPPQLKRASGRHPIDLGRALHMLGTLTMPNILSPASPALFWAWLRYFLAPAASPELRITMDFSDLDPHQKGILSDDFGVAVATQWMVDKFGSFTQIVDGRRFANQFTHLLRRRHKSKAKVDMSKAPDFVMRDVNGKWYVLECKGTQTSRDYQRKVLKTAVTQKHAIKLAGAVRGEQLASSLFIAHENDKSSTHLKIVDPEDDEPFLELTGRHAEEMEARANHLTIAQALGSIGLNEIAVEMSLPPNIDSESELLLPSELRRLRTAPTERAHRATEQVRTRNLDHFSYNHRKYEGRVVECNLPPGAGLPFQRVRIRQGVSADLIAELGETASPAGDSTVAKVVPYIAGAPIEMTSTAQRTALTHGHLLYSEPVWS